MTHTCGGCGAEIDDRPNAKWCSDRCRMRVKRGANPAPRRSAGAPPELASVFEAAHEELRVAGRLDTTLGRGVLVLAARIDANTDTVSMLALAVKQLESSLAAATRGVKVQKTQVDELRARRDAKRRA